MNAETSPEPAKPKKVVSRVVYAAFVTLAGAFIVSSTVQITRAVFFGGADDSGATPSTITPACAEGVRKLTTAVDRAVAAAALGHDAADATRRYRAARSPEWDDPQRAELLSPCTGDAQGNEAAAAVTRFDRAAEGAAGREAGELGTVRRTVDSFIR